MSSKRYVGSVVVAAALMGGLLTGCGGAGRAASASPTTAARGATTAAAPAAKTTTTTVDPAAVDPAALAGSRLIPLIIKRPFGYRVDPAAGATGTITPAAFSRLGGTGSAAAAGYLTGYRQNYVDSQTAEGLTVTVMKFTSPAAATSYLASTAKETMSLVAPTVRSFAQVPGALELDGTRAYDGEYEHGVVMAHGAYYASVVYVTLQPVTLPMEFYDWAKVQYLNLG